MSNGERFLRDTSSGKTSVKDFFGSMLATQEAGVLIPMILLVAVTGILKPDFFAGNNLSAILRGLPFYAIIAVGETLVILLGEIDISVGQIAGLTSVTSTYMMTHGINPVLSIVLALAICAVLGLINGVSVTYLKLSAFITTIGMYYIARGFKFIITKGYPVYPIPQSVGAFGVAEPLGLSWAFLIAIVLLLAFDFILRKTIYGRKLYAVGDNKEVAALAGINVRWTKISVFIISAVLAGFSGFLLSAQIKTGQPSMGDGWELQAIAAAAVGGISLAGGAGTMLGTALGVIFIAVLNNSLVLLSVDTNVQTVLIGVVMLAAVTMDTIKRSRKIKS